MRATYCDRDRVPRDDDVFLTVLLRFDERGVETLNKDDMRRFDAVRLVELDVRLVELDVRLVELDLLGEGGSGTAAAFIFFSDCGLPSRIFVIRASPSTCWRIVRRSSDFCFFSVMSSNKASMRRTSSLTLTASPS